MDMKKLNIPTLDSPNWGNYVTCLQAAFWIFDCYDVVKGEILTPAPNPTYDLLVKPIVPPQGASATDLATYQTAKAIWNKNGQDLSLMKSTASDVIWQDYNHIGVAKDLFDATFGKAGGASTYLQLVNMVKFQFTDSTDLLSQIQQFQDNYNWIVSNGHSQLSKDLATFMFCSSLLDSYKPTTQQYLDNVTAIANYKLTDIITWVLQEESVETEYGEILFQLETEHSDKELYQIIAQSRPVQMISY